MAMARSVPAPNWPRRAAVLCLAATVGLLAWRVVPTLPPAFLGRVCTTVMLPPDVVIPSCTAAIRLGYGDLPQAFSARAVGHYRRGHPSAAQADIDRALAIYPHYGYAKHLAARILADRDEVAGLLRMAELYIETRDASQPPGTVAQIRKDMVVYLALAGGHGSRVFGAEPAHDPRIVVLRDAANVAARLRGRLLVGEKIDPWDL